MYRVQLSEKQRQELQQRAHAKGVMPRTRDRLEMVRLADAGVSIPRIAAHLGLSDKTVRHYIRAFLKDGFDALPDRPHPGKVSAFTPSLQEAVRQELEQAKRTWTAGQLADWVAAQFGLRRSVSHFRRLLRRADLSYKRTARGLHHKQKPAEVAAKKADLETLEKGGTQA